MSVRIRVHEKIMFSATSRSGRDLIAEHLRAAEKSR
jgi:hypothetical protein